MPAGMHASLVWHDESRPGLRARLVRESAQGLRARASGAGLLARPGGAGLWFGARAARWSRPSSATAAGTTVTLQMIDHGARSARDEADLAPPRPGDA